MLHLAALPLTLTLLAPAQDERVERILAIAERYANLEWTGNEANAKHGLDKDGIPVDTPDATLKAGGWRIGETNRGLPYRWGGWDTPEQFLAGLEQGLWAGHWPQDPSGARMTQHAVGVDCSGFLSRCWQLPFKHSTRSLGPLCLEIGWEDLHPGDLLNSFDGHAILFAGWVDEEHTRVIGYESTWPGVVRKERRVDVLQRGGLVPQRYAPLDESWPSIERAPVTLETDAPILFEIGEAVEWTQALAPVRGKRGDWMRYRWTDPGINVDLVRTLANLDDEEAQIISEARSAEGAYARLDRTPSLQRELLDYLDVFPPGQPVDRIERTAVHAFAGSALVGDRRLPAFRIVMTYEGELTVRSRTHSFVVEFSLLRSDELPLEGVLLAERQIWYGPKAGPAHAVSKLALTGFGRVP